MKKINIKKSIATLALFAFVASPFGSLFSQGTKIANADAPMPNWNTTGSYIVSMNYQSADYAHDMHLIQDSSGDLTGSGGSPAGAHVYTWDITSGSVSGDSIVFDANYITTDDAVNPQTIMHVLGTVASDGTMSGTWSDNYQAGDRSGTWTTTTGAAQALPGSLAAEDFGVVNYDSGLGFIKGYTAGFGLTDATFAGAQSVIVKLYADDTLLQTNTSTSKVGTDITGVQISSPFDVSGTFDYATDGYWVNTRALQYGQSVPATKVIATVTLANGKVVTAENTNLTGDPTTIYPPTPGNSVKVTINKYIDGIQATATTANSVDFPMVATWDATNTGPGTGSYALAALGFGGDTTPYQAATNAMDSGASYSTNEVTDGSIVATTCVATTAPFALVGYTVGDTLSEAKDATPTTVIPALTNITSDKYVIVWNKNCLGVEGHISGDVIGGPGSGILAVTSIETVDSTAIADGSFANGWKYVFNVTIPTNETNLGMKFANWASDQGSNTIAVANNMRISSEQAGNSNETIMIVAPGVYSTPNLHMITDLNPTLDGIQVKVSVEVAVPLNTVNGSYSTVYGVRTQ